MKTIAVGLLATATLVAAGAHAAYAEDVTIRMRAIDAKGVGKDVGTIRAVDTAKGLMLVPRLTGLAAGAHGIHVHANPSCAAGKAPDGTVGAGLAAGGHFDPETTGKHEGPEGHGHKGDLPALAVDDTGNARTAMTAPRLKVADLWGRAVVIHSGGDNYSDQPAALGGGGARVACGTIVKAKAKPKSM